MNAYHKNILRSLILSSVVIILCGCTTLEKPLTKVLTSSADVRLEKIDDTRAIVKYNYGALIEPNGKENADKAMIEHCYPNEYKIILSGTCVSGEKRWTTTIVFECVE